MNSPNHQIHDDTGHLWAVSYADFLMVLLSFFILFFSVDKVGKQTIIQRISIATSGQSGTGVGQGTGTGTGRGTGIGAGGGNERAESWAISSGGQLKEWPGRTLKEVFSSYGVRAQFRDERLLLLLPDDLYPKGGINVPPEKQHSLRELLEKLKPFQDAVQITFVGHADSSPVRRTKSVFVNDNFDVSAQRASKALQFAMKLGYSADSLAARGDAEHSRGNRTLSLVISPKGEKE